MRVLALLAVLCGCLLFVAAASDEDEASPADRLQLLRSQIDHLRQGLNGQDNVDEEAAPMSSEAEEELEEAEEAEGEQEVAEAAALVLPALYTPSADVQQWVDQLIRSGDEQGSAGYHDYDYFRPRTLDVAAVAGFNQTRRPTNKLQFLKTYKTGSSTMQGVLFRQALFGSVPMRVFASGPHIVNYETESKNARASYDVTFKHYRIIGGRTTDDLKRWLDKLVPDGLLTTIVRDPVSRAISSHLYYEVPVIKKRTFNIEEELMNMPVGDNTAQLLHLDLRAPIDALHEQIDRVDMLLLNRLDESLVLRHFLWGWPLEDLVYIKTNSCGGPRWDGRLIPCPPPSYRDRLPKALAEKIIRQSPVDALLYQRALDRHHTLVGLIDPSLWHAKLAEFRQLRARLEDTCAAVSGRLIKRIPPAPGTLSLAAVEQRPMELCPLFKLTDIQMERYTMAPAARGPRTIRKATSQRIAEEPSDDVSQETAARLREWAERRRAASVRRFDAIKKRPPVSGVSPPQYQPEASVNQRLPDANQLRMRRNTPPRRNI